MFQVASLFARRCVSWPLVLLGMGLTQVAGGLIRAGAWLIDIELDAS
jgi:hypothetical protein